MRKRKLTVGVGSIEDAAKEFINIWHQVEAGNPPKDAPIEKISFSNERLLFKTRRKLKQGKLIWAGKI